MLKRTASCRGVRLVCTRRDYTLAARKVKASPREGDLTRLDRWPMSRPEHRDRGRRCVYGLHGTTARRQNVLYWRVLSSQASR